MQTRAQIQALLAQWGLSPRKALGQNFLIDQNLITKLVEASGVGTGDRVLEVGPGTGTLTEALLDRGARVVACELDRGLAQLMRDRFGDRAGEPGKLTLIEGDCLASKHELSSELARALGDEPFVLAANLPYGAATPLIATLLAHWPTCSRMAVTIQREMADRLLAVPGTRAYGPLAVLIWATASVKRIATLGPACFWPRPEVTSAMISIERRQTLRVDDPDGLARFCQQVFQTRRKQIGGVLGGLVEGAVDWPAGIEPSDRAERLEPEQLAALWMSVRARYTGSQRPPAHRGGSIKQPDTIRGSNDHR